MNINLSSYVVRFTDGSVDTESTLAKFEGDLIRFEAETATERATIAGVVHAIFDAHPGRRLPMPFLTGEALRRLNAQPENWKILSEKVADFIHTEPGFSTAKGKGGGVERHPSAVLGG